MNIMRLNLQLFASIVDYLNSQGQDSSLSARKKIAQELGIQNYTGTAEQNNQMVQMLKNKSGNNTSSNASTSTSANTNTSTNTSTNTKTSTRTQVKLDGVDQSIADRMNSEFQTSTAYQDAMAKVQGLLDQINSGKTSYTDQIKDLMEQIQNREDFTYDADSDMMFQQYLSSMMATGNTAMQDTMGQASMLTGGYGSSYSQSVGNQAYNQHIQTAYDNLPDFYQMALQQYQMEGDEMYNLLNMLSTADATEYQRLIDSWNANKSTADTMYSQEYQKWADDVASATQIAGMQNSDYWNQKNYALQQQQLALSRAKASSSSSTTTKPASLTNAEFDKVKELYTKAGGGTAGYNAVDEYLTLIGKNNIDGATLKSSLDATEVPVWYQTWTMSKDTTNWFGGDDDNDVYSNGSTTMTYKELKNEINNSNLSKSEKEALLKKLKNQSKK